MLLAAAMPSLIMYLVMPITMTQFRFTTMTSRLRGFWILASPVPLPLRLASSRAERPQEVLPGGVLPRGRVLRLEVGVGVGVGVRIGDVASSRAAGSSSCPTAVPCPILRPLSTKLIPMTMLMEWAVMVRMVMSMVSAVGAYPGPIAEFGASALASGPVLNTSSLMKVTTTMPSMMRSGVKSDVMYPMPLQRNLADVSVAKLLRESVRRGASAKALRTM